MFYLHLLSEETNPFYPKIGFEQHNEELEQQCQELQQELLAQWQEIKELAEQEQILPRQRAEAQWALRY